MSGVSDLGINKDMKPLVRACRRAGWEVETTGRNHVRWAAPSGFTTYTATSGSRRTVRVARQRILRELQGPRP